MLTARMIRIFSYRIKIWQASLLTPFKWDSKREKLTFSTTRKYIAWLGFCIYLFVFGLVAAYRILSQIWKEDLSDKKAFAVDALFNALIWTILGPILNIIVKRRDHISIVNQLLAFDKKLKSEFPFCFSQNFATIVNHFNYSTFYFTEVHGSQPDPVVTVSKNNKAIEGRRALLRSVIVKQLFPSLEWDQILIEYLLIFVSSASAIIPLPFGIAFVLEKDEPLHRFVNEVFGLEPALEMKYIPLILLVMNSILQNANIIAYMLNIGILYLYSTFGWLRFLENKGTIKQGDVSLRILGKNGQIVGIKGDMSLLRTYRQLQVMNQISNGVFGDIRLTLHYGGCLGISIICSFAIFRWHDILTEVALGLLMFGAVISLFIIYMEVLLLSSLREKSEQLVRMLRSRNIRKSVAAKILESCWPFFTISSFSFLIYTHNFLELLTDLLLSIPK
jgi:hypothetical protein